MTTEVVGRIYVVKEVDCPSVECGETSYIEGEGTYTCAHCDEKFKVTIFRPIDKPDWISESGEEANEN